MIQYKEIFCPGRGFLLRTDLVKQFCKTIDEFMSVNQENGKHFCNQFECRKQEKVKANFGLVQFLNSFCSAFFY